MDEEFISVHLNTHILRLQKPPRSLTFWVMLPVNDLNFYVDNLFHGHQAALRDYPHVHGCKMVMGNTPSAVSWRVRSTSLPWQNLHIHFNLLICHVAYGPCAWLLWHAVVFGWKSGSLRKEKGSKREKNQDEELSACCLSMAMLATL